jgi:threonine synthase
VSNPSRLVCSGCGYEVPPTEPAPYRCPGTRAHNDVDHVLRRLLDPGALEIDRDFRDIFLDPQNNPFLKYRELLHSHAVGVASGLDDLGFAVLVEELDAAVARIDGAGFQRTPFLHADELAGAVGLQPGHLWIKDETGNVSGSHKARHLMGLMLWMEMARRVFPTAPDPARQLAIASCGNAALAAAIIARAANRALDVFVPTSADPSVIDRLNVLRARIVTCPRDESLAGDPCFHHFREAVDEGALPFTCQGSENGLVIDGGKTLVWEMVSVLLGMGQHLDHLFIQVGGGALGSACIQGLKEARDLGVLARLPAIHTVQTASASPLHRAWDTLMDKLLVRHQSETGQSSPLLSDDPERARFVRDEVSPLLVREELQFAASHRSEYMWPWDEEPRSIATGILDDETYDWLSLVEGMLTTGGVPLIVSEATLAEAHHLASEHTRISAEPTGTAGLAGLLELQRQEMFPADEVVAVLFTGVER